MSDSSTDNGAVNPPDGALTRDEAASSGQASHSPSVRRRRRRQKPVRSKRRKRTIRGLIALAVLIVVVVGGSAIYVEVEIGHIKKVKVNVTPQTGSADDILLVGSTSRCAVTSSAQVKLFHLECLDGVNGVNSDVIMILRLQPGRTPTLLSIPRDTFVPDARAGGLYNKVDAALADGPNQLVDAIQQDFGIPINHYVVLNFGTFEGIVNALGGISMYFPTTLRDYDSFLSIDKTGCVHINGVEALALVRSRHLYYHYDKKTKTWRGYDGSGDIGRIERVHLFLKALVPQVAAKGFGNPITDSQLLAAIAPDLTVDTTLSSTAMLHIALEFHNNVGNAPEYTLPIIEDTVEYMYKGYPYGLVAFPTEPQDQRTIDAFLGKAASPKPIAPTGITVSVIDGTSSPTSTTTDATALTKLGYKVVGTGAQTSVGPVSETTVLYPAGATAAQNAANLARAEQVKSSLAGLVVLGEGTTLDRADVSVITGTGFTIATPSVVTTPTIVAPTSTVQTTTTFRSTTTTTARSTTTTTARSTTTTTAPVAKSVAPAAPALGPVFSAATPATEAVPPYDPRSCPNLSK
jgi:LCP family protein required for cell wall assembly